MTPRSPVLPRRPWRRSEHRLSMKCMEEPRALLEWVRPQEAAVAAGVALRALYDLVDRGHVEGRLAHRRLLVRRTDAEAWAQRRREAGSPLA